MADNVVATFEAISKKTLNKSDSTEEIIVNKDFSCVFCEQLKSELQKAKTEIASYEEILKIMRGITCRTDNRKCYVRHGEKRNGYQPPS